MFEVPDAKRVRREDLYSPASSPRSSPDPELTDVLRAALQQRLDIDVSGTAPAPVAGTVAHDANVDDDAGSDEELEFRLFAAPAVASTTATGTTPGASAGAGAAPIAQKIRVRSPSLDPAEAGILAPRPRTYYFTPASGALPYSELGAAALSGAQIVQLSRAPWPGCVKAWKVQVLDSAGRELRRKLQGHAGWGEKDVRSNVGGGGEGKKRRKGKKARVALRMKLRAREEKRVQEEKMRKEREEAEREKRTRRNREKKVKKREREKAKKGAGKDGEGGEGGEGEGAEGGVEDVDMAED